MKVVTIIQARTTSSRLPNKVMLDVYGKTLLERVIDQSLRIQNSDKVWVATSTYKNDDVIEMLCDRIGVPCYRGSLEDVRSRFYNIAEREKAEIIVRVTADNPLTEPAYAEQLIKQIKNTPEVHYTRMDRSAILDGTGSEVFTFDCLKKAIKDFTGPEDREHVTQSIKQQPDIYEPKPEDKDLSAGRSYFVGVDTFEDYKRINILFKRYNDTIHGNNVLRKLIKKINNDEEVI